MIFNRLIHLIAILPIPGLIYMWRKFRSRSIKPKGSHENGQINECLFFSPQLKVCRNRSSSKQLLMCELVACSYCSYSRLVYYLTKTEKYIDICQYNLTVEELTIIIVMLFKRGVFVRIITDQQMSEEAGGVKVLCFRREYIPIKVIRTTMIMHNKFIVIDKKIVITGSCNLTKQALDGNFENLIITNNKDMVGRFIEYFQYIWDNAEEFSKF